MPQATMTHEGTTYTRVVNGRLPVLDFYHLRIEADRDLDEDQSLALAGLTGYAWAVAIRGERLGDSVADTDRSVVFLADSTKSASDDLGIAFEHFCELLSTMVTEGTPVRKTNRAGAGTKGTRLIDGLDEDMTVTVWVG